MMTVDRCRYDNRIFRVNYIFQPILLCQKKYKLIEGGIGGYWGGGGLSP